MYHIIRSMRYYARRDLVVVVSLITLMAAPVTACFYSVLGGESSIRDITACGYVTGLAPDLSVIALFACMLIASRITGTDAGDRTLNYELLAGHRRAEAYFGRAAASLLWGGLLVFFLQALPLVYLTVLNGWGPEADMGDVILRQLLLGAVMFRIVSFSVMAATLARGAGKGMVCIYLLVEVEAIVTGIAEEMAGVQLRWWTMITAWMMLVNYDNAKSAVVDGREIMRFETEVPVQMRVWTVVVSVAFGIAYLLAGYMVFRRKDRD